MSSGQAIGVFNSFTSMFRNAILSVSFAVTMLTFSEKFTEFGHILRIMALFAFMLSVSISFKTWNDWKNFLNDLDIASEGKDPHVKIWRPWQHIILSYSWLILILTLIFLLRKIIV